MGISQDEIAEFLTENERNKCKKIRKTYCSMDNIYFLRIICQKKKTSVYIVKPCREIDQD